VRLAVFYCGGASLPAAHTAQVQGWAPLRQSTPTRETPRSLELRNGSCSLWYSLLLSALANFKGPGLEFCARWTH